MINSILCESTDDSLLPSNDHPDIIVRSPITTSHVTAEEIAIGNFTHRKLIRLTTNWNEWQEGEFKQLDLMAKQEMYGAPCPPPAKGAIILRQHWNYSIMSDGSRKARNCCCDGSPRAAPSSNWQTPIRHVSNNLA